MVIIIGALVTLTALVFVSIRLPQFGRMAALGSMSEQWLSEHRASRW